MVLNTLPNRSKLDWTRGAVRPRRGLPRSSAKILIDLVCLLVCLSALVSIFTEWYLHRLQTQKPLVFLKGGSEEGPPKTTFKHE